MPKPKRMKIHLDFLRPQDSPELVYTRFIKWVMSQGRFILVFVELLVLIVFIGRFKFDADLAALKEETENQIPFLENARPQELSIRTTQLQLETIKKTKAGNPDYSKVLQKIASQTPRSVTVSHLSLQKNGDKLDLKIGATAQNNSAVASYIYGLKQDKSFNNINLDNISIEQNAIVITISGSVNAKGES